MQNIFAPWILQLSIGDTKKLNKTIYDKIKNRIEDTNFDSSFLNCNVWTSYESSDDNFLKEEKNILDHMITKPLQDVINYFNYPIKKIETHSWFNAYKEFQWQGVHTHLPSLLSGVYFISFDKKIHGELFFLNPTPSWVISTQTNSFDINQTSDSSLKKEHIPQVNESDLIIFPSGLKHGVKLSNKKVDRLRITYSFNVICKEIKDV